MKKLVGVEKGLGSDGEIEAQLGVEAQHFVAQVAVKYPVAKVIEPATKAVDNLLDKLKNLIPGDWDNAPIDKVKEEYKEQLIKLISE